MAWRKPHHDALPRPSLHISCTRPKTRASCLALSYAPLPVSAYLCDCGGGSQGNSFSEAALRVLEAALLPREGKQPLQGSNAQKKGQQPSANLSDPAAWWVLCIANGRFQPLGSCPVQQTKPTQSEPSSKTIFSQHSSSFSASRQQSCALACVDTSTRALQHSFLREFLLAESQSVRAQHGPTTPC